MGGHHKKNVRAEKAKLKLKGAKLPKGLNVTKTDFKVRKITIREQLKSSQFVDGQRLVNLKETLSRLKHHSSSFRMEALRNLKGNVVSEDPKILSNLNELTQSIAAICLDLDKETRQESFRVLGNLLSVLTVKSVAPFFHVISSYLRCAMTHIQPAIQEDSLLMLDVLLQHVPSLVASDSGKILQNFLEMISKVRAEGDKAGRTLTVNMGNKQTTIKWRSKILLRLQQMLHVLAVHNDANSSGGGKNKKQLTHTFSSKTKQHFPLIRSFHGGEVSDLTAILCKSVSDSSKSVAFLGGVAGSTVNDFQVLQRYVAHLLPLLFESWLEVRPQATTKPSSELIISQDAAFTLKNVLEIIESIWTLGDIHECEVNNTDFSSWLCSEYSEAFASHFLHGSFPYQQAEKTAEEQTKRSSRQKSQNASTYSGGQFCIQQNVNLCFLMSRFYSQNIAAQAERFSCLLKYLTSVVGNLKTVPLESCTYLEKALRSLLYSNGIQLLQLDVDKARLLLNSTVKSFLDNVFPTKEGVSAKVLVLLCDIAQNSKLVNGYGIEHFNAFIAYLPQLLLRAAITEQALLSMCHLGKKKNAVFAQGLLELVVPVIENLQKIQVHGACNAFEGKKNIINLFYWLERAWSTEEQSNLKQKVQECVTDKRLVSYFTFIFSKEVKAN